MFTNFGSSSGYYTDCYKCIELAQLKQKVTVVEKRIATSKNEYFGTTSLE